ncbi:MAG: hypothetical protein U5J83_16185 [Bryobacterales bacterium]|nr:hypothetical protein [Bryobacterales bacterium]
MLVSLATAQSAEDRIVYKKVFKGSTPEFQEIAVARSGAASYKEAEDDPNPVVFKVPAAIAGELFELAASLDHFNLKLESELAIARMGEKTFRFEGSKTGSQTYNYSLDPSAQKLQEYLEKIGDSQRLFIKLEYTARFDRLGIYDALVAMDDARARERLIGTEHFLPLLDRIVKNKRVMNIARDRADFLARYIRESNGLNAQ